MRTFKQNHSTYLSDSFPQFFFLIVAEIRKISTYTKTKDKNKLLYFFRKFRGVFPRVQWHAKILSVLILPKYIYLSFIKISVSNN